jgi:DNA-binding transcriptional regulator LsrR (DeoR family)
MINQQQYEAQLQQIFRLLLENKTQEEIATELHISTRTVARYSQRIEKRYGQTARQKTDDTIFLECQLFKNRMLTLYKGLEDVVTSKDRNISGTEKAKCAEVAANIAIDVIKAASEGLRAVTEIISKNNNNTNKGQRGLENLGSQSKNDGSDNNIKEYNPNRKF